MEYRRYGSASGHPVIVLHSIEYGYMPSQRMIEAARARHLNLIFPIRPGFGDTNATETLPEAADLIAEFIRVLKLEDVTLIGLSTAAPLALLVQDRNARIGQTLLVNYGLNVQDKLKGIQPAWIRGLLRMSLSSSTSFNFGIRTLRSMSVSLPLSARLLPWAEQVAALLIIALSMKRSVDPALPPLPWRKSWSMKASWAGKNLRWKLSATKPTMPSSFVRSRILTQWACIPVTRLPWHRR